MATYTEPTLCRSQRVNEIPIPSSDFMSRILSSVFSHTAGRTTKPAGLCARDRRVGGVVTMYVRTCEAPQLEVGDEG